MDQLISTALNGGVSNVVLPALTYGTTALIMQLANQRGPQSTGVNAIAKWGPIVTASAQQALGVKTEDNYISWFLSKIFNVSTALTPALTAELLEYNYPIGPPVAETTRLLLNTVVRSGGDLTLGTFQSFIDEQPNYVRDAIRKIDYLYSTYPTYIWHQLNLRTQLRYTASVSSYTAVHILAPRWSTPEEEKLFLESMLRHLATLYDLIYDLNVRLRTNSRDSRDNIGSIQVDPDADPAEMLYELGQSLSESLTPLRRQIKDKQLQWKIQQIFHEITELSILWIDPETIHKPVVWNGAAALFILNDIIESEVGRISGTPTWNIADVKQLTPSIINTMREHLLHQIDLRKLEAGAIQTILQANNSVIKLTNDTSQTQYMFLDQMRLSPDFTNVTMQTLGLGDDGDRLSLDIFTRLYPLSAYAQMLPEITNELYNTQIQLPRTSPTLHHSRELTILSSINLPPPPTTLIEFLNQQNIAASYSMNDLLSILEQVSGVNSANQIKQEVITTVCQLSACPQNENTRGYISFLMEQYWGDDSTHKAMILNTAEDVIATYKWFHDYGLDNVTYDVIRQEFINIKLGYTQNITDQIAFTNGWSATIGAHIRAISLLPGLPQLPSSDAMLGFLGKIITGGALIVAAVIHTAPTYASAISQLVQWSIGSLLPWKLLINTTVKVAVVIAFVTRPPTVEMLGVVLISTTAFGVLYKAFQVMQKCYNMILKYSEFKITRPNAQYPLSMEMQLGELWSIRNVFTNIIGEDNQLIIEYLLNRLTSNTMHNFTEEDWNSLFEKHIQPGKNKTRELAYKIKELEKVVTKANQQIKEQEEKDAKVLTDSQQAQILRTTLLKLVDGHKVDDDPTGLASLFQSLSVEDKETVSDWTRVHVYPRSKEGSSSSMMMLWLLVLLELQ